MARACLELLRAEGSPVAHQIEYETNPVQQVLLNRNRKQKCSTLKLNSILNKFQSNGRHSPLTFEKAAEMMLAESNAGNCNSRVQVEFLARPLQMLSHMDNGNCSPEFLNPIPRDELMEESGLFSMQDPFPQMEEHQTSQCQIQVVNSFI